MSDVLPYRSTATAGRDGFGQVLHAEWTKFRTVPGWVAGLLAAVLATVGFGWLTAAGSHCSIGPFPGHPQATPCTEPLGPGGVVVTDHFYFVHEPLAGEGTVTARITSLTGVLAARQGGFAGPGLQPWSKAGIMIKANLRQGSAYAAMLVTGGHGVRMQDDFTGDRPGLRGAVSAASPRWLRLTRSGGTVTGYDSADGRHWARVGAVRLPGLPATVQAGLFATSPHVTQTSQSLATAAAVAGPTQATGVFDHVRVSGGAAGRRWAGTEVGAPAGPLGAGLGGYRETGGTVSVSGSGDVAPAVSPDGGGMPIARTLTGLFAGLIAVAVVAAMFVSAEYRRGLIRTTLAASPRRQRVLAAKAIVIGGVTFVAGLAGAAVAVPVSEHALRGNGNFMAPVSAVTEVRVIAGTAALLAVTAVLALAVAAVLRSGAGAVMAIIAGIVVPYLFTAAAPVLPAGAADWLLRLTPAAAFAIQGTSVQYPQVTDAYLPAFGYFPLAPWAGLAVLCGYTALALGLAAFLLRRRDA